MKRRSVFSVASALLCSVCQGRRAGGTVTRILGSHHAQQQQKQHPHKLAPGLKPCKLKPRTGASVHSVVARIRAGADEFEVDEKEFSEASMLARIKAEINRTPFITKSYFAGVFGLTLYNWFFSDNMWPEVFDLDWKKVMKGQDWRIFTPFFNYGPLSMFSWGFNVFFTWNYMASLEKSLYKTPEDFAQMIGVGVVCLLAATTLCGMTHALSSGLGCYLTYIWSRIFEGHPVEVNGIITIRSELLPWFFVASSLLTEAVVPWLELSGILAGYVYMLGKLQGWMAAPKWLRAIFQTPAIKADYARFQRDFGVEHVPEDLEVDDPGSDTETEDTTTETTAVDSNEDVNADEISETTAAAEIDESEADNDSDDESADD